MILVVALVLDELNVILLKNIGCKMNADGISFLFSIRMNKSSVNIASNLRKLSSHYEAI